MLQLTHALPDDAPAITAIKTRAYNKEINTFLGRDGGPDGYNRVESELDIIRHFPTYKICLDGRLIGALFLIPVSETEMRLEDFVIDPPEQGRGYGFAVLQMVERMCPLVRRIALSTPVFSVGNQHLYEKAGYRRIGQTEEEIEYEKRV